MSGSAISVEGRARILFARNVIVATGGFQSNLKTVLANWPSELPRPSSPARGRRAFRHGVGSRPGPPRQRPACLAWITSGTTCSGCRTHAIRSRTRGLAAFNFNAIWVNAEGKRFTQEFGDEKLGLRALLNQPGGTYWNRVRREGQGRAFRSR